MTSITEPSKFVTPFAESGLKNAIPPASNNTTGKAGFDKGFPERTMLPKASGGIPPSGMDFNGILFDVTAAIRYMQAGGKPTYDAGFAAAIGGYPLGAVLIGDDGVSVFQNSVAGNETNPNTGGAGWARPDLQMMELYRRSYAEAGYNVVGTFQAGFTLVNANDVGIDLATGKGYTGPVGPVAAGTNPASGGFVDRSSTIYGVATVADIGTGRYDIGATIEVSDRGFAKFKIVSGGTPDGIGVLPAGVGKTAVIQPDDTTTIKSYGAKMDLVSDDAPYIQYMSRKLCRVKCPPSLPYENFGITGQLTHGVLIASDIVTAPFCDYDFGFNQVKITNGASFIPQDFVATDFTVNPSWRNLYIVDSANQNFIRVISNTKAFQCPSIERIDINELGSLLKSDGFFGWFNLRIDTIKAAHLSALFKMTNGTGQTGNSVVNGLFQATGSLFELNNATGQCNFTDINFGLDGSTIGSAVVRFTGQSVNVASDKITFTSSAFEYDDTTINTPIYIPNPNANYTVIFDKCSIFHSDVAGMSSRGFYPLVLQGNLNKLKISGGTTEWWSRYPNAQGVYLDVRSGTLIESDFRYEAMRFTSLSKVGTLTNRNPLTSNANITFNSGYYSIDKNRITIVFNGIAARALVAGDVLFDFPTQPTFPQNIYYTGNAYKIRAKASIGAITAEVSIPSGAQIECNITVDLS